MDWNSLYASTKDYWGKSVDPDLVAFEYFIPEGRVLDAGCGTGRNGIYFALKGNEVDFLEPSGEALAQCQATISELDLNQDIQFIEQSVEKACSNLEHKYSLIILSNVLQFLSPKECEDVVLNLKKRLADGGVIYLSTFSLDDPVYQRLKDREDIVNGGSGFLSDPPNNWSMRFFSKSDCERMFGELKTIFFSKKHWLDSGHGEPHYHDSIYLMAKKDV